MHCIRKIMLSRFLLVKSEGVLKEIVVATGSASREWSGPRLSLMAIKRSSEGIEDVSV